MEVKEYFTDSGWMYDEFGIFHSWKKVDEKTKYCHYYDMYFVKTDDGVWQTRN